MSKAPDTIKLVALYADHAFDGVGTNATNNWLGTAYEDTNIATWVAKGINLVYLSNSNNCNGFSATTYGGTWIPRIKTFVAKCRAAGIHVGMVCAITTTAAAQRIVNYNAGAAANEKMEYALLEEEYWNGSSTFAQYKTYVQNYYALLHPIGVSVDLYIVEDASGELAQLAPTTDIFWMTQYTNAGTVGSPGSNTFNQPRYDKIRPWVRSLAATLPSTPIKVGALISAESYAFNASSIPWNGAVYPYSTGSASASGTAVTGAGTAWLTAGVAGGARIGFGTTNPRAVTTWYTISAVPTNGTITLSSSAGTVASGPFVIIGSPGIGFNSLGYWLEGRRVDAPGAYPAQQPVVTSRKNIQQAGDMFTHNGHYGTAPYDFNSEAASVTDYIDWQGVQMYSWNYYQPLATADYLPNEVWAIGDGAVGTTVPANIPSAIAVASQVPVSAARFLYLGDVYNAGTNAEYTNSAGAYDKIYGSQSGHNLNIITSATLGNHEWANRAVGSDLYWAGSLAGTNGVYSPWDGSRTETSPRWYSFYVAGWKFICVGTMEDGNASGGMSVGSAGYNWLVAELADPDPRKIVFGHHPRWSNSNSHGDNAAVQPLWAAMQGKAFIYLCGHDHMYQRHKMRNSAGAVVASGGVHEFVIGAGGQALYGFLASYLDPNGIDPVAGRSLQFGALRMRLYPDRVETCYVLGNGSTFDCATLSVGIAPNVAPTVSAGPNQAVTLPASATLSGSVSDDGLTNPTPTLTWSKVSGPGTVTFGTPSAAATTASFSAAGTYVLRLTAFDGTLTSTSDVTVTASAASTFTAVSGFRLGGLYVDKFIDGPTGKITFPRVTTAGSGYTNGTYAVTATGGGGSGFAGFVEISGGAVTSFYYTSRGAGYTSVPAFSFSGAGTPTVAAVLTAQLSQNVSILGNTTNENAVISFAQAQHLNYLALYDLGNMSWATTGAGTQFAPGQAPLASFISRAKAAGMAVAADRSASPSSVNDVISYNAARALAAERFDWFLVEDEWWNGSRLFMSYVARLYHAYPRLKAASVSVEAYVGWGDSVSCDAGGGTFSLAPTVYPIGGGGSGGAVTAAVSGSTIVSNGTAITAAGSGYTSPPTLAVLRNASDVAAGVIRLTAVGAGAITGVTVTAGGSGMASVTSTISGGAVTALTIANAGSGYAWLAAAVNAAGQVTGVKVLHGGFGYTSAPTLSLVGGGGAGATATATVANGIITSVSVTGGSGYTTPPTVRVTGGGGPSLSFASGAAAATLYVADGRLDSYAITAGGSGYGAAPAVTILGGAGAFVVGGGGSGATLRADLSGGSITNVAVTAGGSGYSGASVAVAGGGGSSPAISVGVVGGSLASELQQLVPYLDRFQVHTFWDTPNFSYALARLEDIAGGAALAGRTVGAAALFSAEELYDPWNSPVRSSNFMGQWYKDTANSVQTAWNYWALQENPAASTQGYYNAAPAAGGPSATVRSWIDPVGFTIFDQSFLRDSAPSTGATPTPTVSASGPTSFCAGGSVTLTSSGGYNSYLWSPGGQTTQSIAVTASGSYTVTGTDASGSATSAAVVVTVTTTPPPTVSAGGPLTFCSGGSVTLTAQAGYSSYLWSPGGQTTQSIVVSTSGTYTVRGVQSGCQSAASAPVTTTVVVTAPPTISAGGPTTFCSGGSVTLTAQAGYTAYLWSPGGQTTQSIVVSASGSYTVRGTASGCQSAASSATVVTVNPIPAPTVTAGGPLSFCSGGSVTLTSSYATGNVWSPGGQTTQSIVVSASGSYSTTVTQGGCAGTSAPVAVTVNPAAPTPTVTAGGPTTFCSGGSVTLTSSAGSSYLWSPGGATTQSIVVSASGSYTVRVTNAQGCLSASSAPVAVTVTATPAAPAIAASGPTAFCTGGAVTLTAAPGYGSYLWSPGGQTTQSILVSAAGSYSVRGTVSGCQSPFSAATVVTVNASLVPSVSVAAGPSTTVCAGTVVTFTATPVNGGTPSYQWRVNGSSVLGATGVSYAYVPADADLVEVVMTSTLGCVTVNPVTGSATMTVTPALPASVSVAASPATVVCGGTVVTFTATPVNGGTPSYQWRVNGSNVGTDSDTYAYSPLDSDVVDVVMTSSLACATGSPAASAPLTMTVSASAPADVTVSADALVVCAGGTVTLTAAPVNGGASPTYDWRVNGVSTGSTGPSYSYSPADGDVVDAVMTSSLTCVTGSPAASNAVVLSVTGSPSVDLAGAVSDSADWTVDGLAGTLEHTLWPGVKAYVDVRPSALVQTAWWHSVSDASFGPPDFAYFMDAPNPPYADWLFVDASGDAGLAARLDDAAVAAGSPATFDVTRHATGILEVRSTSASFPAGALYCSGGAVSLGYSPLATIDYVTVAGLGDSGAPTVLPTSGLPLSAGAAAVKADLDALGVGTFSIDDTSVPGTWTVTCDAGGPVSLYYSAVANDVPFAPLVASPLTAGPVVAGLFGSGVYDVAWVDGLFSVGSTYTVQFDVTGSSDPSSPRTSLLVGIGDNYDVSGWFDVGAVGDGTYSYTATATAEPALGVHSHPAGLTFIALSDAALTISNVRVLPAVAAAPDTGAAVCSGQLVTFTATSSGGGPSPSYAWTLNGSPVGVDAPTWASAALADGDVVAVTMTSSDPCSPLASVTSAPVTMTVAASSPVDVAVSASPGTTVAAGTAVTFTAVGTNPGAGPTYEWTVDGAVVQSGASDTYAYTPANGDVVRCALTSDAACATGSPAQSNALVMVVAVSPPGGVTMTITPDGPTTFVAGGRVGLTATAGVGWQYHWSTGALSRTIDVTVSGTYTVYAFDPFTSTTTNTASIVVEVVSPSAPAGNPIPGAVDIDDKIASFALVRANPRISGNVKLTVDSSGALWLNSFDANRELSAAQFKRYRVGPGSSYAADLRGFMGRLPADIVFAVREARPEPETTSDRLADQYDLFYAMGAAPLVSEQYEEEYAYLAPIWLRQQLPDYFVIFRVDDPMDYPYNLGVASGDLVRGRSYKVVSDAAMAAWGTRSAPFAVRHAQQTHADGEVFTAAGPTYTVLSGAGRVIDLDENKDAPEDAEQFMRMFPGARAVKTFDMTDSSDLGKYVREIQASMPASPLTVRFDEGLMTTWNGVSYAEGVVASKGELLDRYWADAQTQVEFEDYVTGGFARHGIVSPQLLNLEFLFTDDTADRYSVPRYFGFYVNAMQTGAIRLDGRALYDARATSGNLPAPKRPNVGHAWQEEDRWVTNPSGVRLFWSDPVEFSAPSPYVPGSGDFAPGRYLPRHWWVQDRDRRFVSVKSRPAAGEEFNVSARDLVVWDETVNLGRLAGPGRVLLQAAGQRLPEAGRAHAVVTVASALSPNDEVRLYWNLGSLSDADGRYDAVVANDLTGVVAGWGPGSHLQSAYFHPYGTAQEVATAVAGAFNWLDSRTFDAVAFSGRVVFRMRAPAAQPNEFFLELSLSDPASLSVEGGPAPGPGVRFHLSGGTDTAAERLRVPREAAERLSSGEAWVRTERGGLAPVTGAGRYVDEAVERDGAVASLGGFDDYAVLTVGGPDAAALDSGREFVAYRLFEPPVGLFSFFPVREVDGDFWSSTYARTPVREYHRYFDLLPDEACLQPGRAYVVLGGDDEYITYAGVSPDRIYASADGTVFTAVTGFESFSAGAGSPAVVPGIFMSGATRVYDGEVVGPGPYVVFGSTVLLGPPATDYAVFTPVGGGAPVTVDGYPGGLSSETSAPVLSAGRWTLAIAGSAVVLRPGPRSMDADLRSFPGFWTLRDIAPASDEGRGRLLTVAHQHRGRFFQGDIASEYDYLKENYNKDLALRSRLVPSVAKWAYAGGQDVRDNPYRLNTHPVFGPLGFSPSFDIKAQSPEAFTHEWLYVEGRPHQYPDRYIADNYYFFERRLVDALLADADPASRDYFLDYFTYQPTDDAALQRRYAFFDYSAETGLSEAFFRGVKLRVKEVVRDTAAPALRGAKPPYRDRSARYDGYRFSALVRPRSATQHGIQPPVSVRFVENATTRTITMVVDVVCDDYRTVASDIGAAPFAGARQSIALDYVAMYSMRSKLVEPTYPGPGGTTLGTDAPALGDVKLSVPLNLSGSGRAGGRIVVYAYPNDEYDWDLRDELHDFAPSLNGPLSSPNVLYGDFRYGDTRISAPVAASQGRLDLELTAEVWAPWNAGGGTTISVPTGTAYTWDGFATWQRAGGRLYYEPVMQRLSFARLAQRVNEYHPMVRYFTYRWDGSATVETRDEFYVEMVEPSTVVKRALLVPQVDEDRPQQFRSEPVIGVVNERVEAAWPVRRYSGPYEPKFRDVIYFRSPKYDRVVGPDLDVSFKNATFNPTAEGFGLIRNMGLLKVAGSDVLVLSNDRRYRPAYPLLGETAIDRRDFPAFRSSWDPGFWREYLTRDEYLPQAGTREMLEVKNFLGTKIMKTPGALSLETFTSARLDTLDGVRVEDLSVELAWSHDSERGSKLRVLVDVRRRLLRWLVEDGASAEFLRLLMPDFGVGDPDSLDDDVLRYLELNVLPTYRVDDAEVYVLRSTSAEGPPTVRTDLTNAEKLVAGMRPDRNLTTQQVGPLAYYFEVALDASYRYDVAPTFAIKKI